MRKGLERRGHAILLTQVIRDGDEGERSATLLLTIRGRLRQGMPNQSAGDDAMLGVTDF